MRKWDEVSESEYEDILQTSPTTTKYLNNRKIKIKYYNIPVSFDIEVSSWKEYGEKRACMYIWMFDLNGLAVYGRTWKEYVKFLGLLQKYSCAKLVVYVHNLAYEFQFMRKWFRWETIFARKERRAMYARCADYDIEYRCSYLLSGYSLATVARNLHNHKIEKLVGALNYNVKRNNRTKLSELELGYCEHDIRIIEYYIAELIEEYGDITKIPLTQTGFVRKSISSKANSKENSKKTHDLISKLTLTEDVYKMAKRAYRGGFTHANAFKNGKILEHVGSYDFTSSYPAVMLVETYPMSKGREVPEAEYENALKKYHCIFDVEFHGLRSTDMNERILSFSKCWVCKDYVLDNGRIYKAGYCCTTMTEIEYQCLNMFYKCDSVKIHKMYAFDKARLPEYMLTAILDYFTRKTTLKGVEGHEAEYMHSKQELNSMYGMSVTDICNDEIIYDGNEWSTLKADIEACLGEYNNKPTRYLYYMWGIYVTAYAARNLFNGIKAVGNDYIYSDTDSIKFENPENHREYFEAYNRVIRAKNISVATHLNLPIESVEPKSSKGKPSYIGAWDDEGIYDRFKTLGAKRYITDKNGKISITIAGVNKATGAKWLVDKYGSHAMEKFSQELCFPSKAYDEKGGEYCPSGKLTHTYIDQEIKGKMVDYQGNIANYHEKSFCHLEATTYELDLGLQYMEFLNGLKQLEFD